MNELEVKKTLSALEKMQKVTKVLGTGIAKIATPDGEFVLIGTFLGFGTDCHTNVDGQPCHYTTAIIERPDGTVFLCDVSRIKFDDYEK